MDSQAFRIRRVKEPHLKVRRGTESGPGRSYNSSVAALEDAWNCVAAAKEELNTVDHKIRSVPLSDKNDHTELRSFHARPKQLVQIPSKPVAKYYEDIASADDPTDQDELEGASFANIKSKNYNAHKENYVNMSDFDYSRSETEERNLRQRANQKPNISLSRKHLLSSSKCKDGLSKIRDKINLQKSNTLSYSSSSAVGSCPDKTKPTPFDVSSGLLSTDGDQTFTQPMIRKVTRIDEPPAYHGFNVAKDVVGVGKMNVSSGKHVERKLRQNIHSKTSRVAPCVSPRNGKRPMKPKHVNTTISSGAMKRKVAVSKSFPVITTHSWRVGQEAARRAIKESKLKDLSALKSSARPKQARSDALSDAPTIQISGATYSDPILEDDSTSTQRNEQSDQMTKTPPLSSLGRQSVSPKPDGDGDDKNIDELEDRELDITDPKSIASLSEHVSLSSPAKEVLQDMFDDASDDDEDSMVVDHAGGEMGAFNQTRVLHGKPKHRGKRKAKTLHPTQEASHPKCKVRHYDQEDIQKYMEKQIATRNQQRRNARLEREVLAEQQRQKLQNLYTRQKKTLVANLKAKDHGATKGDHVAADVQKSMVQLANKIESAKEGLDKVDYPEAGISGLLDDSLQTTNDESHTDPDPEDTSTCSESDAVSRLGMPYPDSQTNRSSANNETDAAVDKSRISRIEAIRDTAVALRLRIDEESRRLKDRLDTNVDWAVEYPPTSTSQPLMATDEETIFSGWLPGVTNLEQKTESNNEMMKKENAALKIQAVYRGYCVRQTFANVLPPHRLDNIVLASSSSDSLNSLEEQDPILYRSASPSSLPHSDDSAHNDSFQEVQEEVDVGSVVSGREGGGGKSETTEDEIASLRALLATKLPSGVTSEQPGDRYSVINIMARRLELLQELDAALPPEPDTTDLGNDNEFAPGRSRTVDDDQYEHDFETSPTITASVDSLQSVASSSTMQLIDSELRSTGTLTHSGVTNPSSVSSDLVHGSSRATASEDLYTPPQRRDAAVNVRDLISGDSSVVISPCRSPTSINEYTFDNEKDPVMSSTRNERTVLPSASESDADVTLKSSHVHPLAKPTVEHSPGALERKMLAELNRLQSVDDSLYHVMDMERVRDITMAQHETTAMAHQMESRDYVHRRDMRQFSEEATTQARLVTDEMEKARQSAAAAAAEAAQTLSKLREDAMRDAVLAESKVTEAHAESARAEAEARQRVQDAQHLVSSTLTRAADQQLANVESITSKAASTAAVAAVQSALQFHREQLERLRTESAKRLSLSGSSDVGSSSTYSASVTASGQQYSGRQYSNEEFETASDASSHIEEIHEATNDEHTTHSRVDANVISPLATKESSHQRDRIDSDQSGDASVVAEDLDASQTGTNQSSRASTPALSLKDTRKLVAAMKSHHLDDSHVISLTEDELEHEYRMVLPSEAHRRHSVERNTTAIPVDDNASSSDEASSPKHGENRVSPFSDEHSFSRFTTEMVRSYIQEEEVRSRHQAALLKLREKALIEKTKAEMAWIELQKKRLKDKKADDQMPPLNKKQRGLMMKLHANQAEIRRLREAYKTASYERKFMLYQQKEIDKIRQGTGRILHRLGKDASGLELLRSNELGDLSYDHDHLHASPGSDSFVVASRSESPVSVNRPRTKTPISPSVSASEGRPGSTAAEVSEDIPDPNTASASTADENSSPANKHRSSVLENDSPTLSPTRGESFSFTDNSDATITVEMERLKKRTSEKYLSRRELKLRHRREQFTSLRRKQDDLMEWKRRIDDEERRLKSDLQRALSGGVAKERASSVSDSNESVTAGTQHSASPRPRSPPLNSNTKSIETALSFQSESDSSIVESIPALPHDSSQSPGSVHDINQSPSTVQEALSNAESRLPTSGGSRYDYGEETFDSSTATPKRTPSHDAIKPQLEEQTSISEVASDLSDIENRVVGLEKQLGRRRRQLEKIRKRKDKESLKNKEAKLISELQAVELEINQESIHTAPVKGGPPRFHSPRILSPKSSQHSGVPDDGVPATPAPLSPPKDTSRVLLSDKRAPRATYDTGQHDDVSRASEEIHDKSSEAPPTSDGGTHASLPLHRTASATSVDKSEIDEEIAAKSEADDDTPSVVDNEDGTQYESDFDPSSDDVSAGKSTEGRRVRPLSPSLESLSSVASQISGSQVIVPSEDIAILTANDSRLEDSSYEPHVGSLPLDDHPAVGSPSPVASVADTSAWTSSEFHVGDAVRVEGKTSGMVRFVGAVPFSPVPVAGVELDTPTGTSDGAFQDRRYFSCRSQHGVFVPLDQLSAETSSRSGDMARDDKMTTSIVSDVSEEDASDNELDVDDAHYDHSSRKFLTTDEDVDDVSGDREQISSEQDSTSSRAAVAPSRVSVGAIAERISEQLLVGLVRESVMMMTPVPSHSAPTAAGGRRDGMVDTGDAIEHAGSVSVSSTADEVSESYIEPLPSNVSSVEGAVDTASRKLLHEAIQSMLDIRSRKDTALRSVDSQLQETRPAQEDHDPIVESDDDRLIPRFDPLHLEPVPSAGHELDTALLAAKLDDLKSMHSAIDDLLGASNSDDEDEDGDEERQPDGNDFFVSNDILRLPDEEEEDNEMLPLFGFAAADDEERVVLVPYSVAETNELVAKAFVRLQDGFTVENGFDHIDPPHDYHDNECNSALEEQSCRVYRRMVYDLTRAILQDLCDYSDLKASHIQPWLKPPRKAFTKFTRLNNNRAGDALLQQIQQYACGLLGLSEGRPSLDQLKQRLPMNTTKKDYVDALLVYELREEEPEWITYDLDELRVKHQLTDSILDGLLNEIVEIMTDIEERRVVT